jgi:hypothetical protein
MASEPPSPLPHLERNADRLKPLAALVVKEGVSVGGLKEDDRTLVLALAATAFEPGEALTEPQVNHRLKRFLAEEGAFLDVDHVELRRWLVDMGWLQRDGFGRQYQRAPFDVLLPHNQAASQSLGGLAVGPWVAQHKAAVAQHRAARREQWQQAQATPGTGQP